MNEIRAARSQNPNFNHMLEERRIYLFFFFFNPSFSSLLNGNSAVIGDFFSGWLIQYLIEAEHSYKGKQGVLHLSSYLSTFIVDICGPWLLHISHKAGVFQPSPEEP